MLLLSLENLRRMKVLKFGGTSVGEPQRMLSVADLAYSDEDRVVVLSALSGTTNALERISELLFQNKKSDALLELGELKVHYMHFIKELYSTDEARELASRFIDDHFNYLTTFTHDVFTRHEEKAVMAEGELMSTGLFKILMDEQGRRVCLLPALNFMRLNDEGEPDLAYIAEHLQRDIDRNKNCHFFITQGYICRDAFGEVDNLKRGGSDFTASLIGAAIGAEEIQIWTDIDGMHNNDPRVVNKTFSLDQLSFNEAAELAYFGAKILHPATIFPAQQASIPVRLKNTMKPNAPGTLISNDTCEREVKAIAAKDGITAIKIRSGRMLMAYGFLRRVFEVFERYRTPIDMITTSEVAVSLTIDDQTNLDHIRRELSSFGTVDIDEDLTIICIVGDFIAESKGVAAKIMGAIEEVPIRMVSYGGSAHNVSLLVKTSDKRQALELLNVGLFKKDLDHVG